MGYRSLCICGKFPSFFQCDIPFIHDHFPYSRLCLVSFPVAEINTVTKCSFGEEWLISAYGWQSIIERKQGRMACRNRSRNHGGMLFTGSLLGLDSSSFIIQPHPPTEGWDLQHQSSMKTRYTDMDADQSYWDNSSSKVSFYQVTLGCVELTLELN